MVLGASACFKSASCEYSNGKFTKVSGNEKRIPTEFTGEILFPSGLYYPATNCRGYDL